MGISQGGSDAENAYGIATDLQNNVLLTGQYKGTTSLAGQALPSLPDEISGLTTYEFFVSKYDINGNPLWVKHGATEYEDRGTAIACDDQNNVFFVGQFSDTLAFAGNTYYNTSFNAGFLIKLDELGNLQFFNQLKAGMTVPNDLKIDALNNVVLCGDFLGTLNYYDNGGVHSTSCGYTKKVFVLKTSNSGDYLGSYAMGSENKLNGRALAIDSDRSIYVSGDFECAFSQANDSIGSLFYSLGYKDIFMLKLNEEVEISYLKHIAGKRNDLGNDIAIKNVEEPIICGSFQDDLFVPISPSLPITSTLTAWSLGYWSGSYYTLNTDLGHINSYLIKAINLETNAFQFTAFDSIPDISIYSNTSNSLGDTVHFCVNDQLEVNDYCFFDLSPLYVRTWEDSSSSYPRNISSTGLYSIQLKRLDGCYFRNDSVYAIRHEIPPMPSVTDTIGVNFNQYPNYHNYAFCGHQDVEVILSDLGPGITTTLEYSDTILAGIGPHILPINTLYVVHTTDGFCSNLGYIYVNYSYPIPYDSIDLEIGIEDLSLTEDSIILCKNQVVDLLGLDLIQNPLGNYLEVNQVVYSYSYSIPGVGTFSGYNETPKINTTVTFPTTGWYTINLHVILGYNNLCGIDTMHFNATRSIYVFVKPLIGWSNSLSTDLLCPNETVYVVASNPHPAFSWTGPSIIWSNGSDSILVNELGVYHYSGWLLGNVDSCTALKHWSIAVYLKTVASILINPSDAIICPNDSILLSLPNTYLSYNWHGPAGDSLSFVNSLLASEQGNYYCYVLDNEGCWMPSAIETINEFTTPSISVFPQNFLCLGDEVTIQLNYDGNATWTWLNSNVLDDELIVSSPGWYGIEIEQCGMTFIDSIEILDGSFFASISVNDSLLCQNEIAFLTGSYPGQYEWSDGQISGNVLSTQESGTYSAVVTNNFGCTFSTNSVNVNHVEENTPVAISDETICFNSGILLSDTSQFILNWFDLDSNITYTGNDLLISNLQNDSNFIVAYDAPGCSPVFSNITVFIADTLSTFPEITGDSTICASSNASFFVSLPVGWTIEWSFGGYYSTTNPVVIPASAITNSGIVIASISNACQVISLNDTLIKLFPLSIQASINDTTLCFQDTLALSTNSDQTTWSIGGAISTDSIFYVVANGSNQSIFVTGIDSNICAMISDTVTIFSQNISYSIYDNSNTLCIGDSASILLSSNDNLSNVNWQYLWGTSTDTLLGFILDSTTIGNYIVSFTDENLCIYQDSVAIAFNPLSNVELTGDIISGDSLICFGESAVFTSNISNVTYAWSSAGLSSNISTFTIPAESISQNLAIQLILTSACGIAIATDTLMIAPIPSVSIVNDTLVLCPGESDLFEAESTDSIVWVQGSNTSNGNQMPVNASFLSQEIQVYAISEFGCISETQTGQLIVSTINASMNSTFYGQCYGDSVLINAQISNAISTQVYFETDSLDSLNNMIFLSAATNGNYIVQATDTLGCFVTDTLTLSIAPFPQFDLPDTILCLNDIYQANLPLDSNAYSFTDFTGESAFLVHENMDLILSITSPAGCVSTDSIFVLAINCEDELPNVFTPNGDGINDLFYIDDALIFTQNRLIIQNRWGNVVFDEEGYQNDYKGDNLVEGVYFYTFYRNSDSNEAIQGFFTIVR